MSYALSLSLDVPFESALSMTRTALEEKGFGILTEIDLQSVLKAKIGGDIPAQYILGVCRPELALAALIAEPSVGVLLPCNISVQAIAEHRSQVQALDPSIILALTNNLDLRPVVEDAGRRLSVVLARISDLANGVAERANVE